MKILTEYKDIISKVAPLKKAYFTTFNINTQFVEKFILPPLLNSTIQSKFDYADLDRKIIENKSLDIKFFYDFNMLSEAESKQTSVEFYPIKQPKGVFHPKVIYLEGAKISYLMVGSGNLTKAGWSENIECWHWIEITNNVNLIKQKNSFMEAVFKLAGLDKPKFIKEFEDNQFIFSSEDNFVFTNKYVKEQSLFLKTLQVKDTRNLQVWSPYFSKKIDEIIDGKYFVQISHINIIPDLIQNQRIRLEQDTIIKLSSKDRIKFFRDEKNASQTNHSKVWITDEKIAIGSYNFTKEALFGNNFEASLILKYNNIKELNPDENKQYEKIDNLEEEKHEDDEVAEKNKETFTSVYKLTADWKTRKLICSVISNSKLLTDIRVSFISATKLYSINEHGLLKNSKDELSESEKENIFDNILLNKSFHIVDMNNNILFKGLVNEQNISLIDIETKKIASLSDMFSLSIDEIKNGRRFNDREEYEALLEKQESYRYESNNHIDYFDIFTLFKIKNDKYNEIKNKDKELTLFCIRGSSSLLKMKEILGKEKSNGRKDLSLYLMIDELNDLVNKVPTEYGLKVLENVLELKKEDINFIKEIKKAVIKETYCE